jgi:PPOX class probable F420-dependent enzyme
MELEQALAAARRNHQSVLVTIRSSDGRPQLSNVVQGVGDDDVVRVSITTSRAKYKNLQRNPWMALHLNGEDFWSYVVLEGEAELSDVAGDPHDAVVDELVELYRTVAGEHPDWDEYRAAQVSEERVVVRFRPTRAYGLLR